jgi:hypothetical protein
VAAVLLRSSYRQRASLKSRAVAWALALAAVALVILALIELGILPPPGAHDLNPLKTFDVVPVAPSPVQRVQRVVKPAGSPPPKAAPKKQPTPATAPVPSPPAFIQMDSASFAATDIGKMTPPAGSDDGAGSGKDSVAAYGPGEGPGGAPLYYAEWYREPSHAELSTYMPANGPPTGFALIACKTIAAYHVDNCRILGETPGSGFGTAMRRAAWQFLVRPPRKGGKSLIGSWVRIRIDFTPGGVATSG